jgi:hypothetical protein
MTYRLAPVLALLLLGACRSESGAPQELPPPPNGTKKVQVTFDQNGNPVMPGLPAVASAAAPSQPQVAPPDVKGGLKCDAPTDWKSVQPSSAMRMAQYQVPRVGGDTEDGELALFYFGNSGAGGIDETFKRWTAAFDAESSGKAKRTTRKASGQDVEEIEVAGTFDTGKTMSGTMGTDSGARKESALLGAILQTTDGPYYFKLTGPTKTVTGARKAFDKMLDSCKVAGAPQ